MSRRAARALAWSALLIGSLAVLRLGSAGDLAPPPLSSFGGLQRWADARDPATVAIALLRLGTEIVVWYLLALTVLHGVAALVRSRSIHAIATALTAPGIDRVLRSALGAGVMAVMPLTSTGGLPVPAAGTPAADATPVAARGSAPGGTATMRPVDDQVSRGTARMVPHREVPHHDAVEHGAPQPTTWRVSPGESFWSIAEEQLTAVRHRPPADHEVAPYWRAMIEANRHRLVDVDDPDLILPGQVLELPPVPPR